MDYDLFNTLQAKSKELDVSVKQLRKSGYDYAQAYTNYRIAVAEETIKLLMEYYNAISEELTDLDNRVDFSCFE